MATPLRIQICSTDTGLLNVQQTVENAAKLSELLQEDLKSHDIIYNDEGFHDHVRILMGQAKFSMTYQLQIVHHLLTLFGTGADSTLLQKAYDVNAAYQIKLGKADNGVLGELEADYALNAPRYLGNWGHYADFLRYFQRQIEHLGWQGFLHAFIFSDTPSCRNLFGRLFAGIVHPLIHLMYGIEWRQPAIIAEAAAMAAIEDGTIGEFLFDVEAAASAAIDPSRNEQPSFLALLENIHRDHPKLATAGPSEGFNDFAVTRAKPEAIALLSQVRVRPTELEERAAEQIHAAAYVAATASINVPHTPKFDFFLIHHLNVAPFFLTINKLFWIPDTVKARIMEWKLRMDVIQYLDCGAPTLSFITLRDYAPPGISKLDARQAVDLLPRFHCIVDDGHVIKVVRSLLLAEKESRRHAGHSWVRIADDSMWLKIMYLFLRSVELPAISRSLVYPSEEERSKLWVRGAGFAEAWKEVPTENFEKLK